MGSFSYLKLQAMLLSTILLDLWIDPLHQRVPLHQHVGEGGAGEDTDDLGAEGREVVDTSSEDAVNQSLISCRHIEVWDTSTSLLSLQCDSNNN